MSDPQLIELKLFDLMYDKINSSIQYYIELSHQFLIYHLEAYIDHHYTPSEEEDGKYGIDENRYLHERYTVLKKTIQVIETYWDNKTEIWVLGILCPANTISIKFQEESQMREVEKLLFTWLIS